VRLPDIVLPSGGYAIEFWLYPENASIERQLIVGNANDGAAPYVSLLQGTRIETGFTGRNGQPLVCVTPEGAIGQHRWNRVRVCFDPKGAHRMQVLINGAPVEAGLHGNGDVPNGLPVNTVSAPYGGLIGNIDNLLIFDTPVVGVTPAQAWSFDTIDYTDSEGQPLDPPLTPNSADPTRPGQVFGAALVPSTSPTSTGDAGQVYWDARNLSIYSAHFKDLAEFGELRSAPMLLAGADGLLHCYFRGHSDRFCVMQFDAEVARAGFDLPWQTISGPVEAGNISLLATQFGAAMNDSGIHVRDAQATSATAHFCDLEMRSPSGRVEQWRGSPPAAVCGCVGRPHTDNPNDSRLLTGAATITTRPERAQLPTLPPGSEPALLPLSRYAGRLR
jgi:hypothetical protein